LVPKKSIFPLSKCSVPIYWGRINIPISPLPKGELRGIIDFELRKNVGGLRLGKKNWSKGEGTSGRVREG
jgi:hypothetical protein